MTVFVTDVQQHKELGILVVGYKGNFTSSFFGSEMTPPLWNFPENSSVLVRDGFPNLLILFKLLVVPCEICAKSIFYMH